MARLPVNDDGRPVFRDLLLHESATTFAQLLKLRHVPINLLHHCLSSYPGPSCTAPEEALRA
jgi:hypothetical protein